MVQTFLFSEPFDEVALKESTEIYTAIFYNNKNEFSGEIQQNSAKYIGIAWRQTSSEVLNELVTGNIMKAPQVSK